MKRFQPRVFRSRLLFLIPTVLVFLPKNIISDSDKPAYVVKYRVDKYRFEAALLEFKKNYHRLPTNAEGVDILTGCRPPHDCTRYKPLVFLKSRDILDPWENKYHYSLDKAGKVDIVSYGADGKAGGTDSDADIDIMHDDLDKIRRTFRRSRFEEILAIVFICLLVAVPVSLLKGLSLAKPLAWRIFIAATTVLYFATILYIFLSL